MGALEMALQLVIQGDYELEVMGRPYLCLALLLQKLSAGMQKLDVIRLNVQAPGVDLEGHAWPA